MVLLTKIYSKIHKIEININNLTLSIADKDNFVILISINDYKCEVDNIIKRNNFIVKNIKIKNFIEEIIKNIIHILNDSQIKLFLRRQSIIYRLSGFLKIHKTNIKKKHFSGQ